MCMKGQCLLYLTVVMARAFQTEIPQNALQPKQSRVSCDMQYFRNNSSSGLTAARLLIYSAGLLELQINTLSQPELSSIAQTSIWINGPPRNSHAHSFSQFSLLSAVCRRTGRWINVLFRVVPVFIGHI